MSLIQNTLSMCRQYNGIDLNRLNSYLESIQNNNIQQDYNMQVQETLKDLNKKYNIDINEIIEYMKFTCKYQYEKLDNAKNGIGIE